MSNAGLIASALQKTDQSLYNAIDGGNSWKAAITQRGARVKLYRDYERGDHRADMTDQMRNMLRLRTDDAGMNDFNDNYCKIVIDKMAGRVAVKELSTNDDKIDKSWLAPLLERQDFQAAEGMWWRGAVRDGDAFVMVDPITFGWSSEPAYDGYSGMVAIYNQMMRKPVWACKVWAESDVQDETEDATNNTKVVYLIVYQPGKITYWKGPELGQEVEPNNVFEEKFDLGNGLVEIRPNSTNTKTWPADFGGQLPFVSFANQRDNYTRYGDSEIRVAIPLQDVLNRTMYSMVMASEFAAFGVNWSIGMKIEPGGIVPGGIINLTLNDAAGKVITEYTPEQIEFLKACKVGQLEAADISQYTNQIASIVKEISQATQTPIYGITASGVISGDALKQLEIGLIGKVERFQRQNSDALKELIMLTAKMQRVFQPGLQAPEITAVSVTWKSPELLDVTAQVDSYVKMRKDAPGLFADSFYQEKIGQLLGMSKSDIQGEIKKAMEQAEAESDSMTGADGSEPQGGDASDPAIQALVDAMMKKQPAEVEEAAVA